MDLSKMDELLYEENDYQCLINVTQCFNESEDQTKKSTFILHAIFFVICVIIYVLFKRFYSVDNIQGITLLKRLRRSRKEIETSVSCPPAIKCDCRVDKPSSLTDQDLLKLVKRDEKYHNEKTSLYQYGGYIPVVLGVTIGPHKNYTIVKKLGYGTFSTVWLCHNRRQNHFCAVKICRSATLYLWSAKEEVRLLRYIKNANPDHPGYDKVVLIQGCFGARSINGSHICISMELLGPSLMDLLYLTKLEGFEAQTVKNILKQILIGLVYLHDYCRIIHTDLKPENIVVATRDGYALNILKRVRRFNNRGIRIPKSYECSSNWLSDAKLHTLKLDEDFDVNSYKANETFPLDGHNTTERRAEVDQNALYDGPALINPNLQIKIADLGNGVRENDNRCYEIQTRQYRALEVLLGDRFSFSADMWSMGCITYELLTGQMLFCPAESPFLCCIEHHLSLISEIIGPFSVDLICRSKKFNQFFEPDGKLRCHRRISWARNDLKRILINFYNWDEEDATLFETFLFALLEPDQNRRITAAKALNNTWLNT